LKAALLRQQNGSSSSGPEDVVVKKAENIELSREIPGSEPDPSMDGRRPRESRWFILNSLSSGSSERDVDRVESLLPEARNAYSWEARGEFSYLPDFIDRDSNKVYVFATTFDAESSSMKLAGLMVFEHEEGERGMQHVRLCEEAADMVPVKVSPHRAVDLPFEKYTSYVASVDVVPAYRGYGISKELLRFGERFVQPKHGYLLLMTRDYNQPMQNAAKSLGYSFVHPNLTEARWYYMVKPFSWLEYWDGMRVRAGAARDADADGGGGGSSSYAETLLFNEGAAKRTRR
jgi:GNAT superfamily N-acetyltransferase